MKDENQAEKLKIHQILNRHSFYRLPLMKLLQILRLIEMPEARQAKGIQENAFAGIMKITETMTLPQNYSRLMAKMYFDPQVEKDISPQVRDYVARIIEDYLEKIKDKNKKKAIVDTRKDANLYPMMAYNTLSYPNTTDNGNSPKESSNMHLQMYYMNTYNYGNHPQMNLAQPYQTFPQVSTQKQPQAKSNQEQMNKNQQQGMPQKESAAKQVEMRQVQAQPDPHVDIKGGNHAEQNGKMQEQQVKLIYSQMSPQYQMNKSPEIDMGLFSPIINPYPQFVNHNQMKLTSNEVQIQTDLSLLNEEIQVFPRNKPQAQQKDPFLIQKAKLVYQVGMSKRKRKQKQTHKQRQRQIMKQQPLEKIEPNEDLPESPDTPPQKKEVKQYIITVRKEYLDQDQAKEQYQQKIPLLQSKSSQFEKLQRKMSLELIILKKGANMKESLRNCPCKGTLQQQDTFECLRCKRMFHNSCLKCQGLFDIQQCHICKIQMYETATEFKECNGIFYTSDVLREKINLELTIAQYEYFLFRKIRHHEIELRCCRLNDVENVDMTWPEALRISVNGKVVLQFSGANYRKRKDAIILTQHLIQCNYEKMDEKIKICFDFPPAGIDSAQKSNKALYAIGIYFVQKIQFQEFLRKYSRNIGCSDSEYITRLMNLNIDADAGLEIQKLVCNLWDPYARNLIRTPVRGSACLHLQCFDLKNYLTFMYATKNRLWKCPICNKDLKRLLLDRQLKELIRKSVEGKAIPSQITFMKDGRILLKICSNEENDQETPPLVQHAKRKWVNTVNKIEKGPNPKKKEEHIYRA